MTRQQDLSAHLLGTLPRSCFHALRLGAQTEARATQEHTGDAPAERAATKPSARRAPSGELLPAAVDVAHDTADPSGSCPGRPRFPRAV